MSDVISFRLSKENPRETQAYEVLKSWQGRGYSIRQTITEELLKLDECNLDSVRGERLDEINEALSQVCQLLEQMQNGDNAAVVTIMSATRGFLPKGINEKDG